MADGGRHRKSRERVVVLGGGPAGLTAAHELCRAGVPVDVLERDRTVGGLAKTVRHKGYRFDLGGHRFFTRIARVEDLWREVLGADLLLRPRLSRIFFRGRFFRYPLQLRDVLFGLGPADSFGYALSYLNARAFPAVPETTFEDWVCNRFGRRLYEAFFKSYTEKVLGVPCTAISADWAEQRIDGLSFSVALREALLPSRTGRRPTTLIDRFYYPRMGPGMLWQAAADRVGEAGGNIRLNHSVKRVERSADHITAVWAETPTGGEALADGSHFISSIPMRDLVRALDPPAPARVRRTAERLRYRDFIVVALIVDRRDLFPDNWIYIQDERVRVGRIQNFGNWSPHMVPDPTKTCLGLEYFCAAGDDLWRSDDADLKSLAATELERLSLARRADIIDGAVQRVPQAYPVYDVDYRAHVRTVRDYLARFRNLSLVGRNGLHRYLNQDLAMDSAMRAVAEILGNARPLSQAPAAAGHPNRPQGKIA